MPLAQPLVKIRGIADTRRLPMLCAPSAIGMAGRPYQDSNTLGSPASRSDVILRSVAAFGQGDVSPGGKGSPRIGAAEGARPTCCSSSCTRPGPGACGPAQG